MHCCKSSKGNINHHDSTSLQGIISMPFSLPVTANCFFTAYHKQTNSLKMTAVTKTLDIYEGPGGKLMTLLKSSFYQNESVRIKLNDDASHSSCMQSEVLCYFVSLCCSLPQANDNPMHLVKIMQTNFFQFESFALSLIGNYLQFTDSDKTVLICVLIV